MIPDNASAAIIHNRPNRDAKALSLFLIHSFRPFLYLGGGLPPDAVAAPPPPGNNALTSTMMAIQDSREYGSNCNSLLSKQSSDLFSQ